jgi:hypothetical protein
MGLYTNAFLDTEFCDLQPNIFIRNATWCMWGLEFVSILECISFIGHSRRFIVQKNEFCKYLWNIEV